MRLSLLSLPFVAAVLLTGTLGCSKKDEPAPPAPTAGSYKLDGQLKNCQVITTLTTSSGQDYLSVLLNTTPEPSNGWEQLQLLLGKDTSQPASAYKAVVFRFTKASITTVVYDAPTLAQFTLTSTSNGLSGTFTTTASSLLIRKLPTSPKEY